MVNDNNNRFLSNANDYIKSVLVYDNPSADNTRLRLDKRNGEDPITLIDTRYWNRNIVLRDFENTSHTIYPLNNLDGDIEFQLPDTIRNDVSPVILNAQGNKILYSSSDYTEEIIDGETIQIHPILESNIIIESEQNALSYCRKLEDSNNLPITIGNGSIAWGDPMLPAIASGNRSIAIGPDAIASGLSSIALGAVTKVSGDYSYSLGPANTIDASSSIGLGHNLSIPSTSFSQVVLGQYNSEDDNASFIIGDGTGPSNRHNALTINNSLINIYNDIKFLDSQNNLKIQLGLGNIIPELSLIYNNNSYANYTSNGFNLTKGQYSLSLKASNLNNDTDFYITYKQDDNIIIEFGHNNNDGSSYISNNIKTYFNNRIICDGNIDSIKLEKDNINHYYKTYTQAEVDEMPINTLYYGSIQEGVNSMISTDIENFPTLFFIKPHYNISHSRWEKIICIIPTVELGQVFLNL